MNLWSVFLDFTFQGLLGRKDMKSIIESRSDRAQVVEGGEGAILAKLQSCAKAPSAKALIQKF